MIKRRYVLALMMKMQYTLGHASPHHLKKLKELNDNNPKKKGQ